MVTLRPLTASDLDAVFAWQSDPVAIAMAAFTRADSGDRERFEEHQARIRSDPDNLVRAVEDADGVLVGTVGAYTMEGEREVTYWIARERWGEGLASAALIALLEIEPTRPLIGRVAAHNLGSATVLRRAGFVEVGVETAYAAGVGTDVEELVLRLDR